MFIYCPKCKNELSNDDNHYSCSTCGFDYFFNANPAAGILLINDKGQVYLGLRSREPGMGKWEIPGGFINLHESAEDGAVREIKEELGIDLGDLTFFKSYSNDYLCNGTQYYPLDLFFIAHVGSDELKPVDDEEFIEGKFFDIDEVPFDNIAFKSNRKVLEDYVTSRKAN